MVAEAEKLISEMDERGMEIDEFTQSSLTRMYIESGMLEKSWSWFQRFHLGGNMTSECYSANIDAFGERGLFDSMEEHGLIPDRCGYNSLVQMLATADLPQKATFYLRKMQEVGLVIDCVPYLCCDLRLRKRKEATYYVDAMRNLGLANELCHIERSMVSEAEEIFETLKQNGDANEFTYAMMLWRYKDAVATFDEMLKSLIKPDDSTFKSLGIILLKCGVPKNAIEKLELIRKEDTERGLQAWTSTLSSVIDMDDDVTDDDV
ncbi:UNVERIFIED_CONTAM: Pentatricopeptide repeat-containing protein [Sesamum calycinum]|uniref:Pentatricopeptide repeat-containing protein n=1 Tax=Sesamum calycinum TaxID=2727403 RepID=A0AAW2QKG5_9LAMI